MGDSHSMGKEVAVLEMQIGERAGSAQLHKVAHSFVGIVID